MAERVVIFKKSALIFSNPYLIEISTAYGRVFVIAYNMGSISGKIMRIMMSEDKARGIFSQYEYDFVVILSRLAIEHNKMFFKLPQKE